MRAEGIRAWRKRLRLTQTEAGAAIGMSLRQMQSYEAGEAVIPLTVELACEALERRHQDAALPVKRTRARPG